MDASSSMVYGTPRAMTTGRPAAVCPIRMEAAAATPSTRFTTGALALPNRPASPPGCSQWRIPAIPIAPSMTGLAREPEMITATVAPVSSRSRARMQRAEASGSAGRRMARSSARPASPGQPAPVPARASPAGGR